MIKVVYAMGDACPIPVVKTKKAIAEMEGQGIVETLVDNEIAVQNLKKMADQMGLESDSTRIDDNEFRVMINLGGFGNNSKVQPNGSGDSREGETASVNTVSAAGAKPVKKNRVVVVSSETMGEGNDKLGKTLIKAFFYALSQQDELPDSIIFYNGGVKLVCDGSPVLEDLEQMKSEGTEIFACGTCLNFYELTDQVKIGEVSNMYEIVEKQMRADLIIKP